ncbi:RNA polymerase sigma factor [Cryptosporangium aurantiacum]|uniref:RNA polymerase, sigma subunit, ECF family n=1 Tax=Cryptosporangium aurantiacum TaxID=134849 RepID=A0A1M7R8W0_9ACTN|nr:RNA polymerase sigma factor [Cryptosporangium aurantiacum]SHN42764.1 RNA polymerase, sigma subunit, ECF family [Cryptosporangium aurantiacum]
MSTDVTAIIDDAFRTEWGQIVATLIRVTGDWDLAEEAAQDAFAQALARWPEDGVPRRPGAWLTTAARNRALDRLRRDAVGAAKLREVATHPPAPPETHDIHDDRLRLMFTCCHPALALDAQVALTLRTLAGLTVAEIARAFLVSESTLAKRLVRAKQKIRHAGIPYRVPPAHLLPERTPAVLAVLYLLFNEGYAATAGPELVRRPLTGEAVRLARLLHRLMPDEPEAAGLLALMLFHGSRSATRVADGEIVPLEEQDRSRWDAVAIAEAEAILDAALRRSRGPSPGRFGPSGRPGPYQVQAAIAACHATAPTAADTDWRQIATLYGTLRELTPSPVVALNQAVAVGMAYGPDIGLALTDALRGELADYPLFPAVRADLLRRLGRASEAAHAYREAIDRAATEPERRYLQRRLSSLTGHRSSVE